MTHWDRTDGSQSGGFAPVDASEVVATGSGSREWGYRLQVRIPLSDCPPTVAVMSDERTAVRQHASADAAPELFDAEPEGSE